MEAALDFSGLVVKPGLFAGVDQVLPGLANAVLVLGHKGLAEVERFAVDGFGAFPRASGVGRGIRFGMVPFSCNLAFGNPQERV